MTTNLISDEKIISVVTAWPDEGKTIAQRVAEWADGQAEWSKIYSVEGNGPANPKASARCHDYADQGYHLAARLLSDES